MAALIGVSGSPASHSWGWVSTFSPHCCSLWLELQRADLFSSVGCKVQRKPHSAEWKTVGAGMDPRVEDSGDGDGWSGARSQFGDRKGQVSRLLAGIPVAPASQSGFILGHMGSLHFKRVSCVSSLCLPFLLSLLPPPPRVQPENRQQTCLKFHPSLAVLLQACYFISLRLFSHLLNGCAQTSLKGCWED